MNLEDVLDPEYGLQQDEWSLTKPRFGEHGQLEVVGWSGRNAGNKSYIVRCHICAQDHELFGHGHFKTYKSDLLRAKLPCGCGRQPRWSTEQYSIRCNRKAQSLGYKFLGFVGEWAGNKTKLILSCELHGDWNSTSINNMLSLDHGCPECKRQDIGKSKTIPDEVFLKTFMSTGKFVDGTVFSRSNRESSQGRKCFWNVHCPECNETNESWVGNLQKGCVPCACFIRGQNKAYINSVKDLNGNCIAVKYGISNDPRARLIQQANKTDFKIEPLFIFEFETNSQCRAAETKVKRIFKFPQLSRQEFRDGYTETLSPTMLEILIKTFESCGGVSLNFSEE